MEVLLLTGTIKPHCNIEYNNVLKRCSEYERSIERYITKSKFSKIVFAENSGYSFPAKKYEELALSHGKRFEYLDVSATAAKDNISVGDAQIMKDALSQSKLLQNEMAIWKVSGRLWIKNINDILKTAKGNNIFLYARKYDSVQTWLFKAETEVLRNILLTDIVLEKMKSSCIEYVWKDCWEENAESFILTKFPVYPDVEGINSSGNPYSLSKSKLFIKEILLKFGFFTVRKRRSNNELDKRNRL